MSRPAPPGGLVCGHGRPARTLSLLTHDASAPVNPDVSVFVDDVAAAYERATAAGVEIIHPLTAEEWGVTRFFYRDASGNVINVGSHSA